MIVNNNCRIFISFFCLVCAMDCSEGCYAGFDFLRICVAEEMSKGEVCMLDAEYSEVCLWKWSKMTILLVIIQFMMEVLL